MPRSRRSAPAPWRSVRGPDGRERVASGTPWEATVGYSRAVRAGSRVHVSGTTATGPTGTIVGPGDPYRQTVKTLDNIERALRALGSSRAAIVRLRTFVTDLGRVDEVTRALGERFRSVRPAMTLVAVSALVDPAMRVEIEVEADDPGRPRARSARGRRSGRSPRAYK